MFKKIILLVIILLTSSNIGYASSNISVSMVDTQGNSVSRSINAEGTIEIEGEDNEQEFKAGILYGENDKEVTSRYWFGSIHDQHDIFSKYTFWYNFGKIESDTFAGYNLRLSVNPGLGLKFKNDVHDFKIEVGPGLIYEQIDVEIDPLVEEVYGEDVKYVEFYAIMRDYQKYAVKFNDSISFIEEVEYIRDLEWPRNFRVNGSAGLIVKATDNISIKAGPTVKYINKPAPGKKKTDVITSAAIIFNF